MQATRGGYKASFSKNSSKIIFHCHLNIYLNAHVHQQPDFQLETNRSRNVYLRKTFLFFIIRESSNYLFSQNGIILHCIGSGICFHFTPNSLFYDHKQIKNGNPTTSILHIGGKCIPIQLPICLANFSQYRMSGQTVLLGSQSPKKHFGFAGSWERSKMGKIQQRLFLI